MTTPESKVKAKVRKILASYDGMYAYWPVPSGFGNTSLDCLGCFRAHFFSIETKAAGKKPTLRQMDELNKIELAMGRTFVIAGESDPAFDELCRWLNHLRDVLPNDPHLTQDPVSRRAI